MCLCFLCVYVCKVYFSPVYAEYCELLEEVYGVLGQLGQPWLLNNIIICTKNKLSLHYSK